MVYIPNPTDATQPTGNVDASTADDEFRALKAYVLGLALTAGMFMPVRQCPNDGFANSAGDPAYLTAAAAGGLALDLKATGRPLVANFAGGSTGTGVNDRNGTYTGDTANVVTGLAPSATSYIFADYVSQSAWTWGSTLAQPQYGKAYDTTKQALLQFAGAAGSTTFLDDNGTTWTAQGNAKVQTDQFKFGTGGLGGAGAANALNGTTDYIKTATGGFSLNSAGGWAIRAWVRPTALPGAGNIAGMSVANAGTFGALLGIFNNAGTIKFGYYLSSTGAAHDIASGVQGTTTPLINTWYFIELTFDPLGNAGGGTYRLYVNGAQEASTNSALRVHSSLLIACIGSISAGAGTFFAGYIDKPEILPYCQHPNGTAYVVPTAAPSITAVGYAPDFFDIQAMKMYSISAPPASVGVAPTFTQKYRCYFGDVDCSGVIPTAVRPYAFNGRFDGVVGGALVLGATTLFQHNLGMIPRDIRVALVNIVAEGGYVPGDEAIDMGTHSSNNDSRGIGVHTTRNVGSATVPATAVTIINRLAATSFNLSINNWKYRVYFSRGWGGA